MLILVLSVLFGLATDYEVFLLSRVREQWDATGDNTSAVATGLQRTGRIITAAAALLITVAAGFATGQIVVTKLIGVGMAVGIFLDATLVRVVLVPALTRQPTVLAVHAALGLLLLVAGVNVLLRAVRVRHRMATAASAGGLAAIIAAAFSGARFVGSQQASASMAMAVLTGIALLCYLADLLTVVPPADTKRPHG